MFSRNRYLGLALVLLLGLYPIAELTRVIRDDKEFYYPHMETQFTIEMVSMWVLYLCIIPVFLWFNGSHSERSKNNPFVIFPLKPARKVFISLLGKNKKPDLEN
jgi:hypothetical protein